VREAYGPDPLQFGELRLPKGKGPFPVAVIVHGGCWTKGFATLAYLAPLAERLAKAGVATWSVEYRQLGDTGGGWPGTFLDWATATDHLRALATRFPLDLDDVVALGHSAGGPAALWLAARGGLPAGSAIRGGDPLKIHAAIDIDGPGDITAFIGPDRKICGGPVIARLMGGTPRRVAPRYRQGNPSQRLPIGAPQALVASVVLPAAAAAAYQAQARTAGDTVRVLELNDAGHFDMLAPGTPSEALVETLILGSFATRP
jgi:acetyl esterase/lipase